MADEFEELCAGLRVASQKTALLTALQKNYALEKVVESLQKNKDAILEANAQDVADSRSRGVSEALIERLALDEKKFQSIIDAIGVIISQTDPIGEEVAGWKIPNGMQIRQVRVPLGVVAIIYESRPNVTVDAFALAYKSGNAILLRGSSSALKSNSVIVKAIREGLSAAGEAGVTDAVFLCQPKADHSDVDRILTALGKIDVVLPRGGARLIQNVVQNAKIPVIETGSGVCHLFVEKSADLDVAAKIAANAKMQRPGACNAIETVLVQRDVASAFLPLMVKAFADKVELRADKESFAILKDCCKNLREATDEDFGFEFLDFTLAVKLVSSANEAIEFINAHNTKHSECIVTNDRSIARDFQTRVDAACVYVNASTRFTDGGQFGFGAELGISTQKLHARGPMGIKALTTTKFLIDGDGQIR
ncbi:MAG: glutamate-5-semialdehyde dehydrogenase [Treponema sp.]|nr:glutamate-5-semialdehyde dehydrogenase [Treponema sp.]